MEHPGPQLSVFQQLPWGLRTGTGCSLGGRAGRSLTHSPHPRTAPTAPCFCPCLPAVYRRLLLGAALSLGLPRFLTPHPPASILTRKSESSPAPPRRDSAGGSPTSSPRRWTRAWACGAGPISPAWVFFTKPRSASSTSHSSQRKHPGCQLLFMALMTRQ